MPLDATLPKSPKVPCAHRQRMIILFSTLPIIRNLSEAIRSLPHDMTNRRKNLDLQINLCTIDQWRLPH